MNNLTLRQAVEKHGYLEVYDSKNDHIMAHIYIDSKRKLEKLPNGNDIEISKK